MVGRPALAHARRCVKGNEWVKAPVSALAAPLALDGVDSRADALLGKRPAVFRKPANELEFEPLVYVLRPLVVAEHVGGERQGELGGPASHSSPTGWDFQPRRAHSPVHQGV